MHMPRISLTVSLRSLAMDLGHVTLVVSTMSLREIFPLCLIFFIFFRPCFGSFNALMTRAATDGTTDTLAWRFYTISFTADRSLGRMNSQYRPHLRWLGLSVKLSLSLSQTDPVFLKIRNSSCVLVLISGEGERCVVPLQCFLSFFFFLFFFHLQLFCF